MYLKDGTLLVCFLGDRSGGARTVPRLAIWREQGPLEEVALPQPAVRMIARLALPAEPSFTGAGVCGRADRVAAALGNPLPQRSAKELRRALGYGKTHEWRVRDELASALAAQGLGGHVVRGRGRIGLRDATSDVAALVCAVRHEERERAVRLIEAVSEEAPDRVDWLLTEGWWPAVQDSAAAALAQAKTWQAEPRPLPALPAGSATAPSDLTVPWSSGKSQALAFPWVARPVTSARPGPRRHWLVVGAASLAALVAGLVLLGGGSPARAPLPGSWPTGPGRDSALVANLTNNVPLGIGVAARSGDTLLLRMRLPIDRAKPRPRPVAVSGNLASVSSEGIRFYTATTGFYPEVQQGEVLIAARAGDQRLRVVPSTTQLVDSSGRIVRTLADLRFGKWDWVGQLPSDGPYFVDTQLRVVRVGASSPGQVSSDSNVHCDHTESAAETLKVRSGAVVTCTAHLVNLGPSVLPAVRVRIGCQSWSTRLGPSLALRVATQSPDAEPKTTSFSQTVNVLGGQPRGIAYVPRSAELFDASFEQERGDLNLRERPGAGELTVGPLGPGATNALFVRFKARVN